MELPFLYQTRTFMRLGRWPSRKSTLFQQTPLRYRCLHESHQSEPSDQTSFFREKAEAVVTRLGHTEGSTITREEQAAFNNLRRLVGQQRQHSVHYIPPEAPLLNVEPEAILALFTPATSSNAAKEARINTICSEYIHSVSSSFQKALTANQTQGDAAIWKVLRHRVFPLLTFLKAPQQASRQERGQAVTALPNAKSIFENFESRRGRPKSSSATPSNTSTDLEADEHNEPDPNAAPTDPSTNSPPPSNLAPLPILTRVYPAALLIALRLLTKHYPISTLTHALLPYIRSLGASSYILGTNTSFYNTILVLRWNTYSSLRDITSLLSEMEQAAVEFDSATLQILFVIEKDRWRDLLQHGSDALATGRFLGSNRSFGARPAAWWMQPEQVKVWRTVEEWKLLITTRLDELGLGVVQREGPVHTGTTGPGAAAADTPETPHVWL